MARAMLSTRSPETDEATNSTSPIGGGGQADGQINAHDDRKITG